MSKQENSIASKLNELEELIAWFNQDDVDLDEAIKKYEEGREKVAEIQKQLAELKNKITVINKKFNN